jgi:hypothetical protein
MGDAFRVSPKTRKAQPISVDRLGWVVVCGGCNDRLIHELKWWVSPPFLLWLRHVLEKESNIGYVDGWNLARHASGH